MPNGDINKKTYYPAKTFDDDLEGLVGLCADNGWSVPKIDQNDLAVSVAKQRTDRVEHDKLELQYLKVHQQFGIDQEKRHQTYNALLWGLLGAFRCDKATLAQLRRFKRSMGRKQAKPNTGEPETK